MPYQNIDASLSAADMKAIKDAFNIILKKLPFLVSLTPQERKSMFKAGPDSVSFVQNALTAAQDHPTILPASFDIPGFRKDVDLFRADRAGHPGRLGSLSDRRYPHGGGRRGDAGSGPGL